MLQILLINRYFYLFLCLQYVIGSSFEENKDEDDQFIYIKKLLDYNGLGGGEARTDYKIITTGDPMVEITVCKQRQFWITPLKVRISKCWNILCIILCIFYLGKHNFTK